MDEWIEGLVAELRSKSTSTWAAGKKAFTAMPSTVVLVIKAHSARIDPKLLRSHYKQAISHLDQLVQQNDPYAQTLRRASVHLSELLQRNPKQSKIPP
jgi:hypothetical protein